MSPTVTKFPKLILFVKTCKLEKIALKNPFYNKYTYSLKLDPLR
jgi:hypothetical protein